ncbi:MAG: urease accessory protein UreF [Rhodospirillales bacterium]
MTTLTMATPTMIAGADPEALYRLMTWLSPAYPVGGFSYSHGLEHAVDTGAVRDRKSLVEFVETVLELGAGHADAALLAASWKAVRQDDPAALDRIADLADAWRGTAEMALESAAQGAAFLAATNAAWPAPALSSFAAKRRGLASYCVAVGVAAAEQGVALEAVLTAYLQAIVASLVSASLRLVPLGQRDGQATMAILRAPVARAVAAALATDPEDVGTAVPMLDLHSIRHETQYTRLFRS